MEAFNNNQSNTYQEILQYIAAKQKLLNPETKPYHRGYYTGVFDLIHSGHIRALQRAAALCDELIVAVSTDEVVQGYKHRLPIIPFEERIQVVSAIKGVTYAIPQTDLYNKVEVCQALGADVIFSSNEYQRSTYENKEMTPKQAAGVERWEQIQAEAEECGIDVVYFPRSEEVSSTMIKEKIIAINETKQQAEQVQDKNTVQDISSPDQEFSM